MHAAAMMCPIVFPDAVVDFMLEHTHNTAVTANVFVNPLVRHQASDAFGDDLCREWLVWVVVRATITQHVAHAGSMGCLWAEPRYALSNLGQLAFS